MTVVQTDKVDFVGVDKQSGDLILTISDHLDWTDVSGHLEILQEKINCYLRFVESGEIYNSFPEAKDQNVAVEIACKYAPPSQGREFFEKAAPILKSVGLTLQFCVLEDEWETWVAELDSAYGKSKK